MKNDIKRPLELAIELKKHFKTTFTWCYLIMKSVTTFSIEFLNPPHLITIWIRILKFWRFRSNRLRTCAVQWPIHAFLFHRRSLWKAEHWSPRYVQQATAGFSCLQMCIVLSWGLTLEKRESDGRLDYSLKNTCLTCYLLKLPDRKICPKIQ